MPRLACKPKIKQKKSRSRPKVGKIWRCLPALRLCDAGKFGKSKYRFCYADATQTLRERAPSPPCDDIACDAMPLNPTDFDTSTAPTPPPEVAPSATDSNNRNVSPVFALKELVARLHREHHKIQDLLSSLGFALRSFNNLNQFLELIPLIASRMTDADGSASILFDSNSRPLLHSLHCTEGNQCRDVRDAIETALRAEAKEEQSLDDRLRHALGDDIRLFGTSIPVDNIERGRLYVFSRDREYDWTPTRQQLLRLVADQTAVAIENDELTVELRRKERLDRELEIGAEIQNRLLPRQCPHICKLALAARCQTANRVGGDYYDFIPTDHKLSHTSDREASGQWGIVIGDVMGKGVPAGLIMTMTRGMLRAEALNRHSPARILQHLNRAMYADLENSHRFVTLFYSEYDPQTGSLAYSNAAHNPPLLWRAGDRSIDRLDTDGMLVGLDIDSEYEESRVQLFPGDTILYYTDGFTEAANRSGDRFEEENLSSAFGWACQTYTDPNQILDHLFDRVAEFIGPNNSHGDDMTLVVVRQQ